MAWIALFLAGLMEIGWAVGLRYIDGLRKPWPLVGVIAALVTSMWLLTYAVRSIPLGTAYPIWVGVGALGTAVAGIVLFGEAASPLKWCFLLMLLASIAGLKWVT